MNRLDYCEFYITNVCNLSCNGCNRFNNYKFRGFQRWEDSKGQDPAEIIQAYQDALYTQLDLPMCMMNRQQSEFFKHHYRSNWHNQGVMVREIDIIRKLEGW